nr:PREDICTED: uncharacterized protein LOC107399248 [Tribolium castaneum]|eukprot:XP_015840731.1 PREDICTED: uncharacterized protein LOC107399248 [Tribolium castaneum]
MQERTAAADESPIPAATAAAFLQGRGRAAHRCEHHSDLQGNSASVNHSSSARQTTVSIKMDYHNLIESYVMREFQLGARTHLSIRLNISLMGNCSFGRLR